MELIEYFNNGLDYETYKNEIIQSVEDKQPMSNYTELNLTRMSRVEKKFSLSSEQEKELSSIPNDFYVLVITEGWCGDASQSLPVMEKIFEFMRTKIRYIYRDQNKKLMNEYLTDGSESIPILIAIDFDGDEIFHWGPRPQKGKEMLALHKNEPEVYTKDEFYKDLQQYYNKDKGQSIYSELSHLMKENLL